MDDYETGYRDCVAGRYSEEVWAHYTGARFDRSAEWFTGYQDAEDDLRWTRMGSGQMQFGLAV